MEASLKQNLRSLLRKQRRELPIEKQTHAAKLVTQNVLQLPLYQSSQHIAYYLADEGELDPQSIIKYAEQAGKSGYLPVMSAKHEIRFFSYQTGDALVQNDYGILEPDQSAQTPIEASELDLVFMPLVAFNKQCDRLGRGGGYYDRSFSFLKDSSIKKPRLIGLAYEFQRQDALITEEWDVRLDHVATESDIY